MYHTHKLSLEESMSRCLFTLPIGEKGIVVILDGLFYVVTTN